MSKEAALALSIVIILSLLIIFVVSFVLYKRTPVPKGCEYLEISEENCASCKNEACTLRKKEENN